MKRAACAFVIGAAVAGTAAEVPVLRTGPPDWAADAVWYLIVPERFRNGDPGNDPRRSDFRGSLAEPPAGWAPSPWSSDWYQLQPWEKASGRAFYELAPLRRYGGDLQGVLEKLDYIQSLGVNAVLLTPVFEAPSAEKGDPTFLHHVDNNLGPDPDGDRLIWATENPADPGTWKWSSADKMLLRLVQECHRRQMKLVLGAAFDHVGASFWAFRDARSRGAQSKHAGWFTVERFDDPRTPGDEFEYRSVGGARDRPEFRREGDGLAPGPRDHIRTVVSRWGDPNGDGDPGDGIDGWFVEGPERLGRTFWRELRRWVLGINPAAILAGDALWQDREAGRMWSPERWLRGDQLDAVSNYRLAEVVQAFFLDRQGAIPATELDARLTVLREELRPESRLALLNVFDGPQTDRLASQAVNADRPYDRQRSPAEDPKYDVSAPRAEEGKRLRLLAAFQFAYVGAPVVYYGPEAGLWGADDPDCRKPMLWPEIRYEDEKAHPLGRPRRGDPVRTDDDLFRFFQTLGRIRAAAPSLRRGGVETILADDARKLFAFARVEEDRVLAAFNAGGRDQTLELPFSIPSRDLLTGRRYRPRDAKTSVTVPALGAVLLAADER